MTQNVLLEAKNLVKEFPVSRGRGKQTVHAVSGVNLTIYEGETLALVGESGCGKSTLGRLLIRLLPATSGEVFFQGAKITAMKEMEFAPYRRQMQIIFQDPYASLNPRMKVLDIIAEPLVTYGLAANKKELENQVMELMDLVGIPREFRNRYPHQFSGGQRQRIGIARSLALNPKFVVCDEAVSALDVSIQSQILNLLSDLREKAGLTYLFITHDLSVVKYISDRICVMYLGNMVELAPTQELFDNTMHPYTEALLSAIPVVDEEDKRERILLEGDIPSPVSPPTGCKFHTRCRYCQQKCKEEVPEWIDVGNNHYVACHFPLHGKKG